jgi:hypothetical protein
MPMALKDSAALLEVTNTAVNSAPEQTISFA